MTPIDTDNSYDTWLDTVIDTALHPERNGLLVNEQIAEGASYEHIVKRELKAAIIAKCKEREAVTGETSDGYHTFNELYEYRLAYNAALFNEWAQQGKYDVHKSYKHSDGEDCFGGGWFIVMAQLPTGQISNHYENIHWERFNIPECYMASEYDGHTPQQALDRIAALSNSTESTGRLKGNSEEAQALSSDVVTRYLAFSISSSIVACKVRRCLSASFLSIALWRLEMTIVEWISGLYGIGLTFRGVYNRLNFVINVLVVTILKFTVQVLDCLKVFGVILESLALRGKIFVRVRKLSGFFVSVLNELAVSLSGLGKFRLTNNLTLGHFCLTSLTVLSPLNALTNLTSLLRESSTANITNMYAAELEPDTISTLDDENMLNKRATVVTSRTMFEVLVVNNPMRSWC